MSDKTCYQSFSDRIKAATSDANALRVLDRRIDNHYAIGTISLAEFKRLDSMILERLVKLGTR